METRRKLKQQEKEQERERADRALVERQKVEAALAEERQQKQKLLDRLQEMGIAGLDVSGLKEGDRLLGGEMEKILPVLPLWKKIAK